MTQLQVKFRILNNTYFLHVIFALASFWFLNQSLQIQGGINAFPDHIHAWTQSDRLAIATRFATKDLNPFLPGTLNLNPSLKNISPENTGISSMDLPVAEFISGVLMRISGHSGPAWSRLVQLLFAFLGLYALFRMLLELKAGLLSLGPVFLLLGSPAWLYYASGFIPSISAISLALVGSYFFFAKNMYRSGIILATLAGLIRMPLLIAVIAMLFCLIPEKAHRRQAIILTASALLVYLPWFFWKIYLKNAYGSMFLTRLMMVDSFQDLVIVFQDSMGRWWSHLLSRAAWISLGAIALTPLALIRYFRMSRLVIAGLVGLAGGLVYSMLMARQFEHHDYYYFDAFLVPVLLLVSGIVIQAARRFQSGLFQVMCVGLFILQGAIQAGSVKAALNNRVEMGPWDRYHLTLENFIGSDKLLDSLGVPSDASVLVIDAYSTNAPLLLLKRSGFTILNTVPEELKKSEIIPADYAVIQDLFLRSDVTRSWPEIINNWKRMGGNGRISVFKREKSLRKESEFAGIESCKVLHAGLDQADTRWKNIYFNADSTLLVQEVYGPTFRMKTVAAQKLLVWADFEFSSEKEYCGLELIFRLHQGDQVTTRMFALNDYTPSLSGYKFSCMVPFETDSKAGELEFFIHNPGQAKVQARIRDFRVIDNQCRY